MQRFSVREAVEMALQTEKTGYAYYTGMGERFREHKGLAGLFSRLAAQEKGHEAKFERLLEKLTGPEPEGWEEAQNYFRAMMESEFFIGRQKSLPALERIKGVSEALDRAIGFEKETLLFFLGLRDAVSDKAVLDEIIAEEKTHIEWLSKLRGTL